MISTHTFSNHKKTHLIAKPKTKLPLRFSKHHSCLSLLDYAVTKDTLNHLFVNMIYYQLVRMTTGQDYKSF